MTKSEELFVRACKVIPGGVNSPVRAFGSVGQTPRMIASAHGAYMTDEDGNRYLDFVGSWGPMILGHDEPEVREAVIRACADGLSFGAATKREVEMAELICGSIPNVDMVRMVNSGTEAVMSAIRAARGYTGRDKIVKFMGCYHGHSDALLVQAGSGVMTAGIPDSAGVPQGCTKDTLSAIYNDLASVERLFEEFPDEIAAVIVEPVGANMGVVPPYSGKTGDGCARADSLDRAAAEDFAEPVSPGSNENGNTLETERPGFLEGLRSLCTKYGAVLIFDEVITGFRLGFTGAQGYFGVDADLVTYGKIIGAGMPVGAYGGKREIMERVAPVGPVYQAGTLSGNPVAMAAGLAQLTILKEHPEIYDELNKKGQWFYGSLKQIAEETKAAVQVNSCGSLGCMFFTPEPVVDYASAKTSDTAQYAEYFRHMLSNHIYIAPSQFEAMFLSVAHTREELADVLELVRKFLNKESFMQ
ncbi:MAG: glutamate-1-semialdehyde 2,1-aminomutase [Clostridiales bacterium]|nr:glutamate-1-semialdehyde 2,1-aminomutase [Clostridiales bacterium]